jgi:hypothetical protein
MGMKMETDDYKDKLIEIVNGILETQTRYRNNKRMVHIEKFYCTPKKCTVILTYSDGSTEKVPLSVVVRTVI